jgi:opacity protein-like surface antigen
MPYNLKAGPILFDMSAGTDFSFNDNIALSQNNRESDLIITPHINASAHWPVTAINSLNLTLGLGYSKYMSHSEYDTHSISISPDSMLDFIVFVGDFKITLYDSFYFQQSPIDEISLANVATYDRFSNTVGINVDWDLNDLILSLGYSHTNLMSSSAQFDYVDSETDTITQRTSITLNPTTTVGWGNSISFTTYDQDFLNNNWTLMSGPFASIQLSPYLSVSATAGFEYINSDTNGQVGDNSSGFTSWYGSITLTHRINNYLSHALTVSHTNPIGLSSNYVELNQIQHAISWQVIRDVSLGTSVFAEYGQESGGVEAENVWRYGAGINASYNLTRKLSLGLSYNYILRDSNADLRDYYQNVATVSVNYHF